MSRAKKDSGTEWLGEIPAHWEVKRLKQIATIRVSNVDKHKVDGQPIVRLVNYTDVYYNDLITPDIQFMASTTDRDKLAKFSVLVGDTIITKDSETPDDIGVPAYVKEARPDMVCGYHLAILRPVAGPTMPKFIFYATKSSSSAAYWSSMASGLTRYGLKIDAIGSCAVALPPLREQRAIADYLDTETGRIDALVEKKQNLVELLTERRQAIITQAVTNGLDQGVAMRDSGVEWLGEIPAHWEVKRLKHCVSSFISGGTPDTSTPEYWADEDDGIPWVAISDMTSESIVRETEKQVTELGRKSKKLPLIGKGTLLYSMYASLGETAILDINATVNQAILGFDFKRDIANRDYVRRWLEHLKPNIELLSSGNTQENLNAEKVRNIPVFFPPLPEQLAIAEFLDAETTRMDTLVEKLHLQIELLTERRQAVINATVTGKLDLTMVAKAEYPSK